MTAEALTDEQIGQEHQIKDVWPWGRSAEGMVRWECSCGWRSRTPIRLGKSASMHQALRESHFGHIKTIKRARDAEKHDPVAG